MMVTVCIYVYGINIPFFFGPLHTTASSWLLRRKPIDMTASFWLGSEYTGTHLKIINNCISLQLRNLHTTTLSHMYNNIIIVIRKTPSAHPSEHWWTSWVSRLNILGMLGPHRSISRIPTYDKILQVKLYAPLCYLEVVYTVFPACASERASWVATVLLPTPPFPDKTRITWPTPSRIPSPAQQNDNIHQKVW